MYNKNMAHYIVVTGILVFKDKYLIVKRADWEKAFPGRWSVPGGKLEVLDYVLNNKDTNHHWYNVFENLLKREVKEEVGLEIEKIGYVTSMVYIRPDGIPCVIVSLFAEAQDDKIILCPALTDYVWANLDELTNYDLIEGIYEEISILDSFLRKSCISSWKKELS